jgi:hypothetical protein
MTSGYSSFEGKTMTTMPDRRAFLPGRSGKFLVYFGNISRAQKGRFATQGEGQALWLFSCACPWKGHKLFPERSGPLSFLFERLPAVSRHASIDVRRG